MQYGAPHAPDASRALLAPAAAYLVVAVAWSWPLPLHLSTRFAHDPGDPLLLTYVIWWNAHAVPLTDRWWNAPFYWPMHGSLALTDHLAGLSPFTTPIQCLGGSPLLAYNLVLIASTWWTGLATHFLVRRLTSSTLAAFVGGIAFAYAPYRVSMLGHLQLYACWWIPVALLALHAYFEDGRAVWIVVCAGSWLMQGLTNGYFLLFMPVLIACWLAWFTRRTQWSRAIRIIFGCAVAALAQVPFLVQYRNVLGRQGMSRNLGEMLWYSGTFASFLSAAPTLRFWHTRPPETTEQFLFPGITAIAVTVAGLWRARRDRRFQFYILAAIVMTALAFGPADRPIAMIWHPYSWIAWLPGFSGLRAPTRFYMFAVLCLAVAAAVAFEALTRDRRVRPALAVMVFAGLFVDGTIAGMPLGAPPGAISVNEIDARLLSLPVNDIQMSVFTMYRSMAHRLAVVNGYAGFFPRHIDVIDWSLWRQDATVLSELRRGHPLIVQVAPSDTAPAWMEFIGAQPGVEFLGVQSGGGLYRLPALPYAPSRRPVRSVTASVTQDPGWLIADLAGPRTVRAIQVRTGDDFRLLPPSLTVQASMDGRSWTTVHDGGPGGAAMLGALEQPQAVPIYIELQDVSARYVRVNTPIYGPQALTVLIAQ